MTAINNINLDDTMTIAKDASRSSAIDLKGATAIGFMTPAAIEATTVQLGFFASNTLTGTYYEVNKNGVPVTLTFAVDEYALLENPSDLFGVRFLKIEAQTAAEVAVVQATAERVFRVVKSVGLT
jgi:uncharacterized glyoxalase superfamily metalloenzyme YdcJ